MPATQQETLNIIEEVAPSITKLAWTFIHKMKTTAHLSIQDLEQEGRHTILEQLNLNRVDITKGRRTTYLIQAVKTRFTDLMHKSYKTGIYIEGDGSCPSKTGQVDTVHHIMSSFTPMEKEYTVCILQHQDVDKRKLRKIVRAALNLKLVEEQNIRKSIKQKLSI